MQADDRYTDAWGRMVFRATGIFDLLYEGHADLSGLMVEADDRVIRHNDLCRVNDKPHLVLNPPDVPDWTPTQEHAARAADWSTPEAFQAIDVRAFVLAKCTSAAETARVMHEMDLFEQRDLVPMLRFMIYLVETLRTNKVVWGVGRGSSVASFVLFLIGVHKIDALKFGLDVHEFLK